MAVEFSFLEAEHIPIGRALSIRCSKQLHYDFTRHDVRLLHDSDDRSIAPVIKHSSIEIPTEGLASGIYELRINIVVDNEGHKINSAPLSRFVRIQKVNGNIPGNFRISRILHLAVGELGTTRLRPEQEAPPGTYILHVLRGMYPQSHRTHTLAFDGRNGQTVEYRKILDDIQARRNAKYGPIHEDLWRQLDKCDENDIFQVMIWPRFDHDHCNYDKFAGPSGEIPGSDNQTHLSAFQRPKANILSTVQGLEAECTHHSCFPYISAKLKCHEIRIVAQSSEVRCILPNSSTAHVPCADGSQVTPLSLSETLSIHRVREIQNTYTGKGIKAAIWERPHGNNVEHMEYSGMRLTELPAPDSDIEHVNMHFRLVSAVIKNKQPGQSHGYAPDCDLYFANYEGSPSEGTRVDATNALDWAVKQGCSVINRSWRRDPDGDGSAMDYYDMLIDWTATTPPYPLIVSSAGNMRPELLAPYTASKYYNGLIVGNHTQSGEAMFKTSLWQNPKPQDATHDRELPDISATGTLLTILDEVKVTGTSFAAPAVSGTAILLHGIDPILRYNPEATRAIIYASAGRRVGHTTGGGPSWWDEVRRRPGQAGPWQDSKQGVGMLDTQAAVRIAKNHIKQPTTEPPIVDGGWTCGILRRKHMTRMVSPYQWRISTPWTKKLSPTGPPKVFPIVIALAWNSHTSHVGPAYSTDLRSKFGLAIYRPGVEGPVAISDSFDNNYEVVQFDGDPGTTYTIVITYQMEESGSASGSKITWYGLAWQFYYRTTQGALVSVP